MKAVLLALFALLILVSNGIKLQNHGDDVLTEQIYLNTEKKLNKE